MGSPSHLHFITRLLRRWRPPRRLRVTFMGKVLMGLTIIIGVAAINTGNNLLYLVLGILFGIIAASGLLSEEVVRDLDIALYPPEVVPQGAPYFLRARVQSRKKVGTHLLEIALFSSRGAPPLTFTSRILPHWLRRRNSLKELGRSTIRYIPPLGDVEVYIPMEAPTKRGIYLIEQGEFRTRFPFQFYEKIREFPCHLEIAVSPRPRLPHSLKELLHRGESEFASHLPRARRHTHHEEEFSGLRLLTPSDPKSRIHWRRSVHPFPPLVKVFSGNPQKQRDLILGQGEGEEEFETGLMEVAGICEFWFHRGIPFRLKAGEYFMSCHTPSGWITILRILAQVKREDLPPGPVFMIQ